jgi:chromosome segregation ATPase
LITGGRLEPGFSAIVLGMSDAMGFRPDAATCAILITDEDADIYEQAPETKADALAALNSRNAVFLGIVGFEGFVDPGFEARPDDYGPSPGSLVDVTGGEVFNIVDFRSNPGPVLSAIMDSCVRTITGEREPSKGEPTERPAETDERFKLLMSTMANLMEQVEDNRGQLGSLENQVTAWIREVSTLSTTVANLSDEHRDFESLTQIILKNQRQLIEMRSQTAVFDEHITSLSTTVAGLRGEHGGFTARLDAITDRVDSLDAKLKGPPMAELAGRVEALEQNVESLRQREKKQRQEHDRLHGQMGERMASLGEELGSLSTSVSRLLTEVEALRALPEEVIQLQAAVAKLDAAVSDRLKELVSRIETNELAMGKLQEDVKNAIVVTEKFLENFGMLAGRLDTVEGRLDQLQAGLEDLDAQLESDTESLSSRLDELEALSARHQDKLAQVDGLSNKLSQLQVDLAELTARQKRTEAQVSQLQEAFQQLEGLRVQLAQMRQNIAQLNQQVGDNTKGMSENASEVAAIQSQLNQLQEGLDAQDERLRGEIASLRDEMEGNRRAIDGLKRSLTSMKEEIKREVFLAIERGEVGAVEVRVEEDLTTRRLAELALAFSLAAVGVAWLLFMNAAG